MLFSFILNDKLFLVLPKFNMKCLINMLKLKFQNHWEISIDIAFVYLNVVLFLFILLKLQVWMKHVSSMNNVNLQHQKPNAVTNDAFVVSKKHQQPGRMDPLNVLVCIHKYHSFMVECLFWLYISCSCQTRTFITKPWTS